MAQENLSFRVESATTFKPKVIKGDDYSKLNKESERQLSFYPDYVEVVKTKKKGKQDVKRLIRLSDVTDVKTDEKHKDLLRVFVNNKGKTECHQMSILNSGDFYAAKDYFERKTLNGRAGNASPTEAHETSYPVSERPSSKMPPSGAVKKYPGHCFSISDAINKSESHEESGREMLSVANVQYNQAPSTGRSGYKPSVRMSGVDGYSGLTQSYIATSERPHSSHLRSYAYYEDDSRERLGEGKDFNSEFDASAHNVPYRTSYVRSHGQHSHSADTRKHYSRGGSVTRASSAYDEDDFRHSVRQRYDKEYDSEEEDEANSSVEYETQSNGTIIERPLRPRSIPYYTPFIAVRHSKNTYW
ncbi:unnamed protein product [Schistocephalus solidus]|uniref:DUF5734 domain-containing protein n=1 Tax=Schistocephalus solidus TaxID=70667 RepID=A0A183TMC5_SCHSO|nr:unnamed protein product [Schistocephalus solidus]